ncbi:substrate-binding domain-containing protein [Edaphobacter aggregans]|uniref:substrate-binding domain-containing protein n=1 Tax=Edaphobacter aggregans TaxID=570835 RepID=UPI003CCB87FD
MAELLSLTRRPTAILGANDLTAIGALRSIQKHNLSVPENFSIIGFDDIELADILHPPMTTLRLSRSELAGLFFKALETLRSNPHAPRPAVFHQSQPRRPRVHRPMPRVVTSLSESTR